MLPTTTSNLTISCLREYDPLHAVMLCPPDFMQIREVINETQKHYAEENIDASLAKKQHLELIHTLNQHQIKTILLPAKPQYPEQVFTRDIGFVIGDTLHIANMRQSIRQGEEQILLHVAHQHRLPFITFPEHTIEGGDVIIDDRHIWVGDGDRTSREAIARLQDVLPQSIVHRIPFAPQYLHLDCVFNIISAAEALVYPAAFQAKHLKILQQHYDCIVVSDEEQFTLGTNVLSIGHQKIISLPVNQQVNKQLRSRGYEVIEVDITEIIKSGGSFRCITLPITRSRVRQ